jgi:polysaccharide biosynthesis/export protein
MKISPFIVLVLALVGLASCKTAPPVARTAAPEAAQPPGTEISGKYILGPADTISISVWRNAELGKNSMPIDPFGMISMPLIGTVKASGLTTEELKQRIEVKLAKYLVNPQVDVTVSSVKGAKVYVLGEAKTPGTVTLDHAVSAFEAIMLSGGFSADANQSRVLLVRNRDGKVNISSLDLNVAGNAGRREVAAAAPLESGDILYVMPLRIASVETFMTRLGTMLSPFIGIESGIVLAPQAWDVVSGKSRTASQPASVAITP